MKLLGQLKTFFFFLRKDFTRTKKHQKAPKAKKKHKKHKNRKSKSKNRK